MESEETSLGEAVPKQQRRTPSGEKTRVGSGGGAGKRFGQEVHSLFESVSWLEPGEIPQMPFTGAGKAVEEALAVPEVHQLFEKPAEESELYREQGIEVILDGAWLSGVVDRLHVSKPGGDRPRAEVIDFKTDGVESADELVDRYGGQMESYRRAVATILECPPEAVACRLVWVRGPESRVLEV